MKTGFKMNAIEECVCTLLVFIRSFATAHLQVGVNVNADAGYLARDYGVKVANTVDVRTHARKCWVETPSRSLAGMVSYLLGKELPKDPTIRLSRWSAPLQPQQVIFGSSERLLFVFLQCFQVLVVKFLNMGTVLLSLYFGGVLPPLKLHLLFWRQTTWS